MLDVMIDWRGLDDLVAGGATADAVLQRLSSAQASQRLFKCRAMGSTPAAVASAARTYMPAQEGGTALVQSGGNAPTSVSILPSPLLRQNAGSITDLVLSGTLAQLYPMDPFFRPAGAPCRSAAAAAPDTSAEMFAKGFGDKVIQPNLEALSALDLLGTSPAFEARVQRLDPDPVLCHNLFFQPTNVPKNVAYMLMCVANNGFERPGPRTRPVIPDYVKYWDSSTGGWMCAQRLEENGDPEAVMAAAPVDLARAEQGAKRVGYAGVCDFHSTIAMAVSANAPILPLSCWTNGRTGFFDNPRFPQETVLCELFKDTQRGMAVGGAVFSDACMNNIIDALPAPYKDGVAFSRVSQVALSLPRVAENVRNKATRAVEAYMKLSQAQRATRPARAALVRALEIHNTSLGELAESMRSVDKITFLVPDGAAVKNAAVRKYYERFFAGAPAAPVQNDIMPVYGDVSYLDAANLNNTINSPGYGGGAALMLWLALGMTLFPENPNHINDVLNTSRLSPNPGIDFRVEGLEGELNTPSLVRNFNVVVLQAICREIFAGMGDGVAGDGRDASLEEAQAIAQGTDDAREGSPASKRRHLLQMNKYLLGKNLVVCNNEVAARNNTTSASTGLEYVPAESRPPETWRAASGEKTSYEQQSDAQTLETRGASPGFLGLWRSRIGCLFEGPTDNHDLVNYTNQCALPGSAGPCAPLSPRDNFALLLSTMQLQYIKLRFRSGPLLDSPGKAEFVGDLGRYGLKYIEKYLPAAADSPAWLASARYRNSPEPGSVGVALDPSGTIYAPTPRPGVGPAAGVGLSGSGGGAALTSWFVGLQADGAEAPRVPAGSSAPGAVQTDALSARLREAVMQGTEPRAVFVGLLDQETGDAGRELSRAVQALDTTVRNYDRQERGERARSLESITKELAGSDPITRDVVYRVSAAVYSLIDRSASADAPPLSAEETQDLGGLFESIESKLLRRVAQAPDRAKAGADARADIEGAAAAFFGKGTEAYRSAVAAFDGGLTTMADEGKRDEMPAPAEGADERTQASRREVAVAAGHNLEKSHKNADLSLTDRFRDFQDTLMRGGGADTGAVRDALLRLAGGMEKPSDAQVRVALGGLGFLPPSAGGQINAIAEEVGRMWALGRVLRAPAASGVGKDVWGALGVADGAQQQEILRVVRGRRATSGGGPRLAAAGSSATKGGVKRRAGRAVGCKVRG